MVVGPTRVVVQFIELIQMLYPGQPLDLHEGNIDYISALAEKYEISCRHPSSNRNSACIPHPEVL